MSVGNPSGEESIFYESVSRAVTGHPKQCHWNYQLSYENEAGTVRGDFERVVNIDITQDFVTGFTDNIVATVRLYKDDYINRLYPIRNALLIEVVKTQLPEKDSGSMLESPIVHRRFYRGVLVDGTDIATSSNHSSNPTKLQDNDNNDKSFIDVKVQLFDLNAEIIMSINFGAIFKEMECDEVCRGVLDAAIYKVYQQHTNSLKVPAIDRVKFHLPTPKAKNNEGEYIIIPHGTPLMKIPYYLQDNYNLYQQHKIGSYINENGWHLYSAYDFDTTSGGPGNIEINILPKSYNKMPERTYFIHLNQINVACFGSIDIKDRTVVSRINEGDNAIYWDKRNVSGNMILKDSSGIYLQSDKAKVEVGKGGFRNVYDPNRTNSNAHDIAIKQSLRDKQIVNLEWSCSSPVVINPGMRVAIKFYKNGRARVLNGVLIGTTSNIQPVGNMSVQRFVATTMLHVLVGSESMESKNESRPSGVKKTKMNSITSVLGL